ncbi:MAG: hypothetical protein CVV27_12080 [Candidatus Melainabacteria bacterium HGW-Melainabacteria-1]|nr:MAG: hypothetical protein CVV27_12080 [Candidatus Melainabacteria bacterium HGW-Melainabacteria-1]
MKPVLSSALIGQTPKQSVLNQRPSETTPPEPTSEQIKPDGLTLDKAMLAGCSLTAGTGLGIMAGTLVMPPVTPSLLASPAARQIAVLKNQGNGMMMSGVGALAGGLVSMAVADNPKQGLLAGAAAGAVAGALTAGKLTGTSASSLAIGFFVGAVGGAVGGTSTSWVKQLGN